MLAAAWTVAHAETVHFKVLKEGVLEERLRLATKNVQQRYLHLRDLFDKTGCANLREQKVGGSKQPNLICPIEGTDLAAGTIVVGAHFDCAGGDGVVDNWTGAILLPSLAEFIREKPRRHTFEFVGFAAEELGLVGSKVYLKKTGKAKRSQITAMVNMDSLGLGPIKYWPNGSDNGLAQLAANMAFSLKLSFEGINVDRVGSTDSQIFHLSKIPTLSLHSVTQATLPFINSKKDVWSALSWSDYYETHRFVSALLIYLDQKLP